MSEYYYISLKHTKKNDAVFTLWGPNHNGYCWYKEWAGIYKKECNKNDMNQVKSIKKEIVDKLFETCIYDMKIVSMLMNNESNRRKLKISKKSLLDIRSSIHRYDFIKWNGD